MWGAERARHDRGGDDVCGSSSDESSWDNDESSDDDVFDAMSAGGGGLFNDDDWCLIARCEVEEASDEWREAFLYCRHDNIECYCVHFGGDEYEGIPEGNYRFDRRACRLYDGDGDLIEVRDVEFMDGK